MALKFSPSAERFAQMSAEALRELWIANPALRQSLSLARGKLDQLFDRYVK